MQVQDQPAQMWSQAQAALQKMPPLQQFYLGGPEPLKLYEQQLQPPLSSVDKKVKVPDFYWDSYVVGDRMKRPLQGGLCAEQEGPPGPRGPPFEVS